MNTWKSHFNLPIYICMLLLLNFVIILAICLVKGQLEPDTFLRYTLYAAFINIVIGIIALLGNLQSRATNHQVNLNIYPRKTSDELIESETVNRRKGRFFTIGLEITGVLMFIIYLVLINNVN